MTVAFHHFTEWVVTIGGKVSIVRGKANRRDALIFALQGFTPEEIEALPRSERNDRLTVSVIPNAPVGER